MYGFIFFSENSFIVGKVYLHIQGQHVADPQNHMGRDATKAVFGVSDKVSFKPVSSSTETS